MTKESLLKELDNEWERLTQRNKSSIKRMLEKTRGSPKLSRIAPGQMDMMELIREQSLKRETKEQIGE